MEIERTIAGSNFEVGLTRDFLAPDGKCVYKDIGLSVLDAGESVRYRFLDRHETTVTPDMLSGIDAVISLTPKYTAASFLGLQRLTAIVRFGVGYDMIDVKACTDADVLLCITAGAVNHSVAEAIIAWMLALNHRVFEKDRLVREGRWAERMHFMGGELRGRTLGIVGLGGIGERLVDLLKSFGMNHPLTFDPYVSPQRAAALRVRLVPLEQLMRESDFISVNCPLTEQTRNLIGRDQIASMKPTSFLINTARGGIVNEEALLEALKNKRIAGAATDVYSAEPAGREHPFAGLDNVLLAPHCIAWTDELFSQIGTMAAQSVLMIAGGRVPVIGVVNREVLERPGFQRKLTRYRHAGRINQ